MSDSESREEFIQHVETMKQADSSFRANQTHRIEGATVDLGRLSRCGFGEVIFGEGKSAELVTHHPDTDRPEAVSFHNSN